MGFRYRGSLSFHDFYFLNERTECPSWGGPISVSVRPRFLYGLRQSTLIQWSASRRLILGGNYGNAYCQLVAATTARSCDRGCQVLDPLKRRKRFACKVWESDGCISDGNGSVDEMLSLMTDVISMGSRKRNGRVAAESVGKTEVWRCCDCQKEKEVRVDDRSRREVKYVESGLQGRKSKGQIKVNADEGYWRSRIDDLSRDDNRAVRKGGSSSSYYSMSSSGDFESNIDEAIRVKRGNVFGESSSSFKNDSRFERMGVCEEEVKQIQEYGDDRRHMESSTKRNAARVSMEQGDRVRLNATESGTKWGLKRDSEKLTEMSELQESDIQRSSSSENHSKMRRENRQDISTSSIDSVQREREQFTQKDQRITRQKESGRKSHILDRISKINENDSGRASSSQKKFDARTKCREDISLDVNLIEEGRTHHRRIDQQDIRQTETRNQSQKLTEESEIYDIDIERASSLQKVFKTGVSDREENSTLILNSVHEAIEQCNQTDQQAVQESREYLTLTDQQALQEVREQHFQKSQEVREQHTLTGQQVVQKVREQHIQTDQQVVQEMREQRAQTDQKAAGQIQMTKESHNIDMSRFHSSVVDRASSSHRVYKMGTNNQEETLTSVLNQAQEDNVQQYQRDEQIIQQDSSRKESHAKILESRESDIERASRKSQALLKTRIKDRMESSTLPLRSVQGARQQQIGVRIEENTNSQVIATPPRSQMVLRGSMPEAFSETIVSSSGVLSTRPEGNVLALHESDERTRKDDIHDDALGSASRLEASSAQFFGEFAEKIQQEDLIVRESSSTSKSTSEIQKDSRRFSTRLGTKGPSDEMWHVAGPSSQEPSVEESPKKGSFAAASGESPVLTNAGNIVVRRSGRSFWTFIADVFLRSWVSRTESHTSTAKSAPKSSSNESLNSEAYFTGREPEDGDDENVGKRRRCMPKEPLLPKDSLGQPSQTTALSQIQEASEMTSSGDETARIKADASTSTGTSQRHAAIRSTSSVSGKGDSRWTDVGKGTQAIHLGVVSIDSSLPIVAPPVPSSTGPVPLVGHPASSSSGLFKADTAKGEILEISRVERSRSGFSEIEEPTRGGISEGAGIEVKDGQVKQRKLQRTNQVLKERFDEWEEAFRLEHEQRKADEMFMREALLEAKKAAVTWEVPVGAVLVHNGKIIARGCNLVEGLRDSTAHAEMICIREASNFLRSWRLAETTLYVTLEPCPMCAGAILQSRIDTVVWGAPNKLLGADGSWVSLFPSGGEGGGNGPVHPFHPKIKIRRGILATECSDVMQQFFQLRRKQNKQPESPPSCLPVSNYPSKFMSKLHNVFSTMFCL